MVWRSLVRLRAPYWHTFSSSKSHADVRFVLWCQGFIRLCIWASNPNVKKRQSMSSQASATVLTRCQHFSVYLLKYRLNLDVIVYAIWSLPFWLPNHAGRYVFEWWSLLVCTLWRGLHRNTFTRTSRRGVAYFSIISQIKGVFEFPLI